MRKNVLPADIAVLLFVCQLSFAQIRQEPSVVPAAKVKEVAAAVDAQKQQILNGVDKLYQDASALTGKKQYQDAAKVYEQIHVELAKLGPGKFAATHQDRLAKEEKDFYRNWSRALESQANSAYLDGEWDKAVTLSSQALAKAGKFEGSEVDADSPAFKDNAIIKSSKSWVADKKFKEDTAILTVDPENENNKKSIEIYLMQAKVFLKNKRYVDARDVLEKIQVLDPYNYEAMRTLQLLYRNLFDIGRARREAEEIEALSEDEWGLSEPVPPPPAEKVEPGADAASAGASNLMAKLDNIIIDKIDFNNADISAVINLIRLESKRFDPENTGISVVLKLDRNAAGELPKITMQLDDIPVGEVIKYICQATKLQYRVEERAVIIGNESINIMKTRTFTVRAALITSIAPSTVDEETEFKSDDGKASGGQLFDTSESFKKKEGADSTKKSLTSEQLIKYFDDRGIQFPNAGEPGGASIAYDRKTGKLIVTNTPENLTRMDMLLRELDIVTPLVLIETKFVEISQKDIEELGFDWFFTKTANDSDKNIWAVNPWTDAGGKPANMPSSNDSLMRHMQSDGTVGHNSNVGKLVNGLKFTHDNMQLEFFMYALDRSGSANILSAPKVIATSGAQALIRMVREEYFPESWNEPETSIVGNNGIQYTPSYPEFGDAQDIGIRLEVTPQVSPNNYTISLELHPEVIDFTGWSDYSYDILLGDLGRVRAKLVMPEISHRDVTTNVKIYDGETVILGGMLKEQNKGADDRVPGLGDVPLVGRLFRSVESNVDKTNLLIFVTARLVNPDGIPVRKNLPNGVFDFRR